MFRKHFKRFFCILHEKNTGLYGYIHDFSVDYDAIAVNDIHMYLMKKNNSM